MTSEDLELVISVTKHERYRDLTDPAHPDYHDTIAPYINRLAQSLRTGEPLDLTGLLPVRVPEPPIVASLRPTREQGRPLAEVQEAIKQRRTCRHWTKCPHGCGADDCALKGKVSVQECIECVIKDAGFSPRDMISQQNPLQLPPPSEPRQMQIVDNPQTIGDLANNNAAYKAILADDTTALAAAQAKIVADTTASSDNNTAFGAALAKLGKSYGIDNGDGTGVVYRSDGNGGVIPENVVFGSVPIPA